MCYERQPRKAGWCACGHGDLLHADVEAPLLAENHEGPCERCECPEFDGLPHRYPFWMGDVFNGETVRSQWNEPVLSLEELIAETEAAAAPAVKRESHYRDLLARQVGGRTEVTLPFGRADVLTDAIVFEVEPAKRWRDGAAQALQYAAQVKQRGALALYGDEVAVDKVRRELAGLPSPGLELWWLKGDQFVLVEKAPVYR